MEQLCYWCTQPSLVLRDVLKSATERIVVTDRRVIDAQRRINGGCEIFSIHRSLLGPTWIIDIRGIRGCRSQRSPALNPSTADQRGVDEVVIPASAAGYVSDCAAKFAFDHDKGVVEHRS